VAGGFERAKTSGRLSRPRERAGPHLQFFKTLESQYVFGRLRLSAHMGKPIRGDGRGSTVSRLRWVNLGEEKVMRGTALPGG